MQIYCDHNAATPMPAEVRDFMCNFLREEAYFANPSSLHAWGSQSRAYLEAARMQIASLIHANKGEEVVFTSGGTEGNNAVISAAVYGVAMPPVLFVSGIEHKSVLRPALAHKKTAKAVLAVTKAGVLDLNYLEEMLNSVGRPVFCSVMHANNETGVIQPIEDVAEILSQRDDCLLHVDCCQSFGKIPVDVRKLGADYVTFSAHKVGGPKGVGALWVKEGAPFRASILGGHQERDRRAGTENVAGALAFAKAAQLRLEGMTDYEHAMKRMVNTLFGELRSKGVSFSINGEGEARLPNTINLGFYGIQSEALVLELSMKGIYVSNGSACESGSVEGSHVLQAMGQSPEQSQSAIRFSFGTGVAPVDGGEMVGRTVARCVKSLLETAQILL